MATVRGILGSCGASGLSRTVAVIARLTRVKVFAADEIAIVHVMNRTVRRCFLLGDDSMSGKNIDWKLPPKEFCRFSLIGDGGWVIDQTLRFGRFV